VHHGQVLIQPTRCVTIAPRERMCRFSTDGTLASEHLAAERERPRKGGRRASHLGLSDSSGPGGRQHGSAWDSRGTGQRFHSQRISERDREPCTGRTREARMKGMRSATTDQFWRFTRLCRRSRWNAPPATSTPASAFRCELAAADPKCFLSTDQAQRPSGPQRRCCLQAIARAEAVRGDAAWLGRRARAVPMRDAGGQAGRLGGAAAPRPGRALAWCHRRPESVSLRALAGAVRGSVAGTASLHWRGPRGARCWSALWYVILAASGCRRGTVGSPASRGFS
jgi:hypothetical protein